MEFDGEIPETQDYDKEKLIKLLADSMERGEIYSCGNFTIFAKIININDGDLEYQKKFAVVYDRQADMLITGELGLRFIGENMYSAEIVYELQKEDRLLDLWDPELIEKNNKYSEFLTGDAETIGACSELVNEDYISKIEERIHHNSTFLDELKGIKDDLDPADLNFGESYLTLETAITELEEKVKKLRNLLEFGTSDLKDLY
ncbi:MAG: hypothetical protein HWN67_15310 [Candidatus Helarchaeota archaeon]|nr:hypothetical protein [Candidatus Helarchaeota archaeon]